MKTLKFICGAMAALGLGSGQAFAVIPQTLPPSASQPEPEPSAPRHAFYLPVDTFNPEQRAEWDSIVASCTEAAEETLGTQERAIEARGILPRYYIGNDEVPRAEILENMKADCEVHLAGESTILAPLLVELQPNAP